MRHTNDLGKDPIFPLVLRLAIPTMMAQFVSVLYSIVDRMYIGAGVGSLALAGVGVCAPIVTLLSSFASLIGLGGSPIMAMRMGAGDEREAQKILNNSFFMLLVTSVILTLGFLASKEKLLMWFGASQATFAYANTYVTIYTLGTVFALLSTGMNSFLMAQGFSGLGMVTVMLGAVLNIILDPIAIYVLDWGIAGAAAATAFSQIVSGLMVIYYFTLSSRSTMKLRLSKMRIHRSTTLKTAELGFSSFLQQFTGSLSQSVLLSCLALFATASTASADIAQASVGITVSIGLFFLLPAIGVSSAIQPIISYNYGAKNYHRVVDTLKTATIFSVSMLTAGWIIILIFAEPLCKIFGCSGESLKHAAYTMRVYNMLLPLVPFGNVGSGFFQSIGQPKKAILISLSRQILCLIPMVLILGSIFGQNGVLYALPVADLVSSAIALTLMILQCRALRSTANAS